MIPRSFEYFDPASIPEAIDLLGKHGEDARLLAGGQSLLPMMKIRLASPKVLVDLWRVPELAYIREKDGTLAIGAMTTHFELQTSRLLRDKLPVIPETAGVVGDPQVRNLGTIGGSAVHAAPNADYSALLVALEAALTIVGPRGERVVPARDFFKDAFTTAIEPVEVLKEIRVPLPAGRCAGAYLKLSRRGTDFAVVSAAAILWRDGDGLCQDARVVLGGLGTIPIRAGKTEGLIRGKRVTPGLIGEAADAAVEGVDALSDVQADSQYRLDVARVYARRSIQTAWDKIS